MNVKTISKDALEMIEQYKNFKIGNAVCSVPYFNNKKAGMRGGLRAEIGKGNPKDIFDEVKSISIKNKIDLNLLNSENLKRFLVDNNLGIDCSGFVYYILNEESEERGMGSLDRHLSFILCKGIFGKIKAKIRPVENTDVKTFAHDKNSKVVSIKDVQVGDIITMIGKEDGARERDHILVIYKIEYQDFLPIIIHYIHAVAWPTDGEYGHGIHEGKIKILDIDKSIVEQEWIENEKVGKIKGEDNKDDSSENYTFQRAVKSMTEVRRLRWV